MRENVPKIEAMSMEDIDTVLEIGTSEQYFCVTDLPKKSTGFWPRDTLERWVLSENDVALVAKTADEIIGFVLTTVHPTNRKAEVENLWVDQKWRGTKVSQMLMDATLESLCRNDSADVVVALVEDNNRAAQSFMQKRAGFTKGKPYIWMTRRIAS
jgi:ribosomal protein S18 acetylase RimI-like enzyme